ncbi:cobalt transporter [Rhizobiales bacterium RZME27]|uniref:Cobalt transporter n=1 Tax=Endobacterium cereale TaxID=2663029 RepID=A0A6A8A5B9_9HYPH|nr:CbtA family protein [Endobacterium cereale]MEB2844645.1 CbtA family protein [Endobacterium cereale]MQY45037.1 cobalt transporter [Endobacterium cereale]
MFRSIVFSAVPVGIITGIAITLMQMVGTEPLILKAETYEDAGPAVPESAAPAEHSHAAATPAHDHAMPETEAEAHDAAGHDHGEGWAPADGFERTVYTLGANVLTAIGYSLVLTALLSMTSFTFGWRTGLFFGIGGFASVMLAPMVGLPPELPGSPAAELAARQTWWIATAVATAAGIGLLVLRREAWAAVLAVILIAAPHVVGAPLPPAGVEPLAPLELERRFVVVATVTSFVFWALLGALSGTFLKRLSPSA